MTAPPSNCIWRFFLVFALCTEICRGLMTMSSSPFYVKKLSDTILVIGGTGRVGRTVVRKLVNKGFDVRVLCRNIVAAQSLPELSKAKLFEGDVCNLDSLIQASAGCSTVVDVHGMKPSRIGKITDLFNHPKNIPYHPYNVNYLGVKRILTAMETNKVKKIIRITGAFVDKSAFSPLRVLFNVLLSMTSAWHEASEIAIRNSGLDYTVIRPTEIVNTTSVARAKGQSLYLLPGDAPGAGILSHIPIEDLSDLLVMCVGKNKTSLNGDVSTLSRSTAICGSKKFQGPTSWTTLIEKIPADTKVLKLGKHKLAIALYVPTFLAVLTLLGNGLFQALNILVKSAVTFYTQKFNVPIAKLA